MDYRPPSFRQPIDYGIPQTIDDIFNKYIEGRQRAIQSNRQANQDYLQAGASLSQDPQEFSHDPHIQEYIALNKRGKNAEITSKEAGAVKDVSQADLYAAEAWAKRNPGLTTPKPLDTNQRATIEGQIMDDYLKSPTFSNLAAAKSGLRDLASIQNNKAGAADIGAIYSFIKTMDNNAVKEGEIQLAQSALPGLDRMKLIVDKLRSGNSLTPEMKKEMLNVAHGMYKSKLKSAQEFRSPFVNRANQYGINPDIAAPSFDIPQSEMASWGLQKEGTVERTGKLPGMAAPGPIVSYDGGATWHQK